MTQIVKTYKVILDQNTTNSDKNLLVDLGDTFQFHGYRDLISLRSETYFDELFQTENPTIDFEKYKFRPDSTVSGFDFYFYKQSILNSTPISYDDSLPPYWAINDQTYKSSSGFNVEDVPNTVLFLDSYFKFEFSLSPISQKNLFSVVLPLNGTMLQLNSIAPQPSISFGGPVITEVENIYWLRKPQQLPNITFSGGILDLYCTISFFNSKTGRVIGFKRDNNLPNSLTVLSNYTTQNKYVMYRLDYNNLTYKILHVDGTPFSSNKIKLYSI